MNINIHCFLSVYNEIYQYLKKRNYDDKLIEDEFNRAINDRKND